VRDDLPTLAQRLRERGERRQLHRQELRVIVGGREVGRGPGQPQARRTGRRRRHALGDRHRVGQRARAKPAHSRVQLDVHPDRPAGNRDQLIDEPLVPRDNVGAGVQRERQLGTAERAQHQQRRRDPVVA